MDIFGKAGFLNLGPSVQKGNYLILNISCWKRIKVFGITECNSASLSLFYFIYILGVFVNLRKLILSLVISVSLSFHLSAWNKLVFTGPIFMKFLLVICTETYWRNRYFTNFPMMLNLKWQNFYNSLALLRELFLEKWERKLFWKYATL